MSEFKISHCVIPVLCLSELFVIGLLVFSHGFLLTRQVIEINSTCHGFTSDESIDPDTTRNTEQLGSQNGCWMKPSFEKAVIIIIDALRYDFAHFNVSLRKDDATPYLNKMPVFREIMDAKPKEAMLVPFIADAPTTTMQRLKGLTTGSLPTFIDASQNFASEEISEDNIIDQLVKHQKQVIVLGDDTWNGLFPRRFKRSFLFPSFNVMDLHTVDNGILQHLEEELQKNDWNVMISHFLGVDHCGHRYGPDHPEMTAKLSQMNDIIKNVADRIGTDTLLLVFGDHGMTKTGDHGGDSQGEITAALFAYSPGLNMMPANPNSIHPVQVSQVDIVPTLALALGVPIPYSNLGKVVEELLTTKGESSEEVLSKKVQALAHNVQQVQKYLLEYKKVGNEFSGELWNRLEKLNRKINKNLDELTIREKKMAYIEYLNVAKMMCEEVWAKFNIAEMTSGLILMVAVMALIVLMVLSQMKDALVLKRLLPLTVGVNALFIFTPYASVSVIGYVASGMIVLWLYFHQRSLNCKSSNLNTTDGFSLFLTLCIYLGSFSNSYVVVENYVISFMLLSLVIMYSFISFLRRQRKKNMNTLSWKNVKVSLNVRNVVCFMAVIVLLVSVRGSSSYWKCREEQPWCVPSQAHTPMIGLPESFRNWRYFTSLFALVLLVWLPRRWLIMCGNLNGSRLGVLLVNYVPVITGVFVAAHWALQAAPLQNSPLSEHVVVPPRLTFAVTILFAVTLFCIPLLIYEVPPKKSFGPVVNHPYGFVPQVYHKLIEKYHDGNSKNSNIPVVYGLATAVSAPVVSIVTALLVVLTMLAGDGLAPAVLVLVVTATSCFMVQAVCSWMTANDIETLLKPSWTALSVWFILSVHGFYVTGHQPTFSSLHWSAAFVGFTGDWGGSNFFPALLVGFNTFMAQILFGLSLPLIVLAPLAIGVAFPRLRGNRLESEETSRGEFLLVDRPEKAKEAVLFTAGSYILLHAAKVFCSSLSAFVLRRHLMVWKIFAPHFIFEAVGFLVTGCCVVLSTAFFLRILKVLYAWSEQLRIKNS